MAFRSTDILEIKGISLPKDAFVVIVRTSWNAHVVDLLEEGCKKKLSEAGVNCKVITVPGAFEISFAIKHYWESKKKKRPHAFIALGCVIKGDTPHFEYVCQAVTYGVTQLNLQLPVPVIFGVLTVNNQAQADERTQSQENKGEESAATALKMISLAMSFK